MLPQDSDLFWKWKAIYEVLQDPITTAVGDKYFLPIMEKELSYCQKAGHPLSIAILNIPNLMAYNYTTSVFEIYTLIRNIINKIREKLNDNDLIFYDSKQTFLFLFPQTDKEGICKIINNIELDLKQLYLDNLPLTYKGGYAEFPGDADNPAKLKECACHALSVANNYPEDRIVGYFTEGRNSLRIPFQMEVRYTAPNSNERLTCSRNISETGILLNGMPDLILGNGIRLSFSLPYIESKIIAIAKSVWNTISFNTGKMNIGLHFICITDTAKEQINKFALKMPSPIQHL